MKIFRIVFGVGVAMVCGGGLASAQIVFPNGSVQSTAAGGVNSTVTGVNATVAGGIGNTASGDTSTVSGGDRNTAGLLDSTVGGGSFNDALGMGSTVGGGQFNAATADTTTIGGGVSNQSSTINATIGGGFFNLSDGDGATVAGGFSNEATNLDAAVGGGSENFATGIGATIPGGSQNTAGGDLSFAQGFGATVDPLHDGATLFADSNQFFFLSNAPNEFAVRATGGVRLISGIDIQGNPNRGVALLANGGTWFSLSDRNAKEDIEAVTPEAVLDGVLQMPVHTWQYAGQENAVRHLGPMAQDFHAAFQLGPDDKHIAAIDMGGVALAAIQGLTTRTQTENAALRAELDTKSGELEALETKYEELAARIAAMEAR